MEKYLGNIHSRCNSSLNPKCHQLVRIIIYAAWINCKLWKWHCCMGIPDCQHIPQKKYGSDNQLSMMWLLYAHSVYVMASGYFKMCFVASQVTCSLDWKLFWLLTQKSIYSCKLWHTDWMVWRNPCMWTTQNILQWIIKWLVYGLKKKFDYWFSHIFDACVGTSPALMVSSAVIVVIPLLLWVHWQTIEPKGWAWDFSPLPTWVWLIDQLILSFPSVWVAHITPVEEKHKTDNWMIPLMTVNWHSFG